MKKRDLLGYGAASFADAGPYNFVTVFYILFLTTVAGIAPETAGTISSAVILLDGLVGAVLGYISDNLRSASGRRRPFLLASVAPFLIGLVVMFSTFPGSDQLHTAIYFIAGVVFWTGFGTYYTPYTALGAEVTTDYDERSILRTYARYFALAGNFLGVVFPLIIISKLQQAGVSEHLGWTIMAFAIGTISVICILITWRSTRGKDIPPAAAAQGAPKAGAVNLIKDYLRIAKFKPFKYVTAISILFIIANTFYNSSMVFFTRYSLGIGDDITSLVFLITMLANLAYTPIAGYFAVRFDKKTVLSVSMLVSGLAGILFFAVGIHSFFGLVIYVCLFGMAYSCFWQLINALIYDLTEVGTYVLGRRIEGSISSISGIMITIGTSIATLLLGWVLKFQAYRVAFLLIPGLVLVAAGLTQAIYPINKERFNQLIKAIDDRDAGRTPDLTGLGRII